MMDVLRTSTDPNCRGLRLMSSRNDSGDIRRSSLKDLVGSETPKRHDNTSNNAVKLSLSLEKGTLHVTCPPGSRSLIAGNKDLDAGNS